LSPSSLMASCTAVRSVLSGAAPAAPARSRRPARRAHPTSAAVIPTPLCAELFFQQPLLVNRLFSQPARRLDLHRVTWRLRYRRANRLRSRSVCDASELTAACLVSMARSSTGTPNENKLSHGSGRRKWRRVSARLAKSHHSLNSPACSCASVTLPA